MCIAAVDDWLLFLGAGASVEPPHLWIHDRYPPFSDLDLAAAPIRRGARPPYQFLTSAPLLLDAAAGHVELWERPPRPTARPACRPNGSRRRSTRP